jgi:hypothetical protein
MMNLTTGPAAQCFPGPIKFDEKGRRVDVPMIFAQWQKGVPITVFPTNLALADGGLALGLTVSERPSTEWPPWAKGGREKKERRPSAVGRRWPLSTHRGRMRRIDGRSAMGHLHPYAAS